jgi:hypothetical protein
VALLVLLALVAVVSGGLALHRFRRDRARLRVVEGQMAALRALLRIEAAEHVTRARLAEAQRRHLAEWDETR